MISILECSCMHSAMKQGSDGKDQIDQEAVNRLVDYAIEHGVNCPKSSCLCTGRMSTTTGIAWHAIRNSYCLTLNCRSFQRTPRKSAVWRAQRRCGRKYSI